MRFPGKSLMRTCERSDKVSYPGRHSAAKAMRCVLRKGLDGWKGRLNIYRCADCHGYHYGHSVKA